MSDTFRFSKSVVDYASGALELVNSRIVEVTTRTGKPPSLLVLHEAIARQLITELKGEQPPAGAILMVGSFNGVPLEVCQCGNPLAQDLVIDCNGKHEEL